jgi:hypothetical protein
LQGARLETYYNGDWWESQVLRLQDDRVKIHYIGGKKNEDEWLPKSSLRLRPPQSQNKAKTQISSPGPSKSTPKVMPASECREVDSNQAHEDSGQRPVRQSRITAGDARLAYMLQEEEMKATRKILSDIRKRKRQPSPQPSKEPNIPDTFEKTGKQSPRNSAIPAKQEKIKEHVTGHFLDRESNLLSKSSCKDSTRSCVPHRIPSTDANKAMHRTQAKLKSEASVAPPEKVKRAVASPVLEEKNGMVSFFIHADSSSEICLPALKRRRMCLAEDCPIFQIKRLIVDEILPGMCATKIELRTQCGALVGQDHTLKYVRAVLWPKSRGDLTLLYRLSQDKML